MSTDYKPCEVRLVFGDGEYLFRLPLKWMAELQVKCGAPIGTIHKRILAGEFYAHDLYEVVRCGLIGGGVEPIEAKRLIDQYCDVWPMQVWFEHAAAILTAVMHGYSDGTASKKKDETMVTSISISPEHTETAPLSESAIPGGSTT